MGCQKVVKVIVINGCFLPPKSILKLRVGQDLCRRHDGSLGGGFLQQGDITLPVVHPQVKQEATEKLTRDPDPGFTNPGTPVRQRKVVVTSEKLLIDHDSVTKQDYTEITFDVIILPSPPRLN
jgi:hypothetical protein